MRINLFFLFSEGCRIKNVFVKFLFQKNFHTNILCSIDVHRVTFVELP